MGKKSIRLPELTFEVSSTSDAGKAIDYIKEKKGRNYSNAIARILIMRWLPFAIDRGCLEYEKVALKCAVQCQQRSEEISTYGNLAWKEYKYRYPSQRNNLQDVKEDLKKFASFDDVLKLVIEDLKKVSRWHMTPREFVIETLLNYYLPFTVSPDDPEFKAIATRCANNCHSWANFTFGRGGR